MKDSQQKTVNKGLILGIAAVVVIAVLLGIIIYLVFGTKKVSKDEPKNVVVNSDNAEQVAEEMLNEEYVEPGYYSTQMSTTWHFATGDAVSEDAYVKNDITNTNDVFFDVFLASDESTPILQSPVIPRGMEMDKIALDTPLDAGTYDCVMVYHLIDEEQNTLSTLRIGFTIIVEE